MTRLITIIICLYLTACSTVTIQPNAGPTISNQADYTRSKAFFFWGLVGEHEVDVRQICGSRPVTQMQTQATIKDSACSFITFGIYSPHTVKVWCGPQEESGHLQLEGDEEI